MCSLLFTNVQRSVRECIHSSQSCVLIHSLLLLWLGFILSVAIQFLTLLITVIRSSKQTLKLFLFYTVAHNVLQSLRIRGSFQIEILSSTDDLLLFPLCQETF